MNREEIEQVASQAAREAVREVLVSLGIDLSNPIRTQQDMASVREMSRIAHDAEYQADQIHLRKWRVAMESASKTGFRITIATIFAGTLGLIWIGLQQALGK